VTIVAAMILGLASFGHKGVIFPLLVRGIGVLGSIISTYTVKAGPNDTSDTALHSVHQGFWIGSAISVLGFVLLGFAYLHMGDDYMRDYPQALAGYTSTTDFDKARVAFDKEVAAAVEAGALPGAEQNRAFRAWMSKDNVNKPIVVKWTETRDGAKVDRTWTASAPGYGGKVLSDGQSALARFLGTDVRPIITCFIGIVLAIVLNKLTSYYTHTSHSPVKSLARACQTGHATNIIQGFAVGYESAVMATIVMAISIALSVFVYYGSSPVFIAYGVAMAGIGMLTLTGNTISMDVFGPVAL
jgi:K(+)-stimulated pyrophosphate-energized sodium pump